MTERERDCVCVPGVGVDPGVVHRWRDRCRYGAGADVSDDVQRLFERVIHAEHLVAPLRLFSRLLHQTALITRRVQIRQQLRVDELLRLTHTQTREQSGLRKSFRKTLHALNKRRQTERKTDRQTHTRPTPTLTLLIIRCMMVLGIRSRMLLLTMPM